ncbi:MAG: hypothetical protein KAY65_08145 [Planctomycetes bacterium]|nr:hypothetical protein [Planctomycetota bacterium]
MKRVIFLCACLLAVIPCQAKTITVEAPQPVRVTIEADDFDAGSDISTAFDGITLSNDGWDSVYVVTSTHAGGKLGIHSIGPGLNAVGDIWDSYYGKDTLRIDFANGAGGSIGITVAESTQNTFGDTIRLKAYDSGGVQLEFDFTTFGAGLRKLRVSREYFDIAYATIEGDGDMCLDQVDVELLPAYQGFADFEKIQDAIDSASDGDVIEVWSGMYYERIDFYGMAITVTSVNPNDGNGVNGTIVNGTGSGNAVTFESLEDSTSILAGFTIQDADIGIYCYYSDPLIKNCVIKSNIMGIDCDSGAPTILDTFVRENSGPGIRGCEGEISGCIVADNSGEGLVACQGLIEGCKITGNGLGLSGCEGEITECVINGNLSNGIANSNADISNCTIVSNKGHGITGATRSLTNNIIVNNWNYGVDNVGLDVLAYNNIWGNLDGSYSNVIPCPTDIHKPPRFAIDCYWDVEDNWVEGEYHLKSAAGRWTESNWIYDDVNSPCIDTGDPCEPIGSEPNPNGDRINIGAYGGTAEASKSPTGIVEPVCAEYPAMDFDKDCRVGFKDFALFAQSWLDCNLDPPEACWE